MNKTILNDHVTCIFADICFVYATIVESDCSRMKVNLYICSPFSNIMKNKNEIEINKSELKTVQKHSQIVKIMHWF
jgi:hypothetical protein